MKQAWIKKKVYVSRKTRCCKSHLQNKRFTDESLAMITGKKNEVTLTDKEIVQWVNDITSEALRPGRFADFGVNSDMTSDDYKLLTGLSREEFDALHGHLSGLRNTDVRTTRDALAILLMKLRLNLSQSTLAFLFKIKDQSSVSKILANVSASLACIFVPKYLGFAQQNMPRELALTEQTPSHVQKVLELGEDSVTLVMDGTYLYIEKPSGFKKQHDTWSLHKNRNLIKPMVTTTILGYIVDVSGPFKADNNNTDAKILNAMIGSPESILSYLKKGDCIILDRGFRDSREPLTRAGIEYRMPEFLQSAKSCKNKGEPYQKQFSTAQGNNSRRVTMFRFVVESAHGRIKNKFPFFDSVIPAPYVDEMAGRWFKIACAIMNAFYGNIVKEKEMSPETIDRILKSMNASNELEEWLKQNKMERKTPTWRSVSAFTIQDFPKLTFDDLHHITMGPYQVKIGEKYAEDHLLEDPSYEILVHRDAPDLIRTQIRSRFSPSVIHNSWIRYISNSNGHSAIRGYYCQCKVGSRNLGTCGHITSVSSI
jgi:hypothetical protein